MVLNTLLVSKMKWKSSQDENAFKNESTCKKLSWKKVNAFLIKTVNCWENVIKYGKKSLTAFKKDLIVNQCTIKIKSKNLKNLKTKIKSYEYIINKHFHEKLLYGH